MKIGGLENRLESLSYMMQWCFNSDIIEVCMQLDESWKALSVDHHSGFFCIFENSEKNHGQAL